jgi:hypothetical protein
MSGWFEWTDSKWAIGIPCTVVAPMTGRVDRLMLINKQVSQKSQLFVFCNGCAVAGFGPRYPDRPSRLNKNPLVPFKNLPAQHDSKSTSLLKMAKEVSLYMAGILSLSKNQDQILVYPSSWVPGFASDPTDLTISRISLSLTVCNASDP